MKRLLFGLVAVMALVSFNAMNVNAATVDSYIGGTVAGGIVNSRHNLGAFGKVIHTDATTNICVFCHTPHHANQADGMLPLWNRATAAPSSFTAYGSTIGGSNVASSDIGSVSLACLSCHDGVTTFDNIVNAPGMGGVTSGGAERNWRFKMPSGPALAANIDHFDPSTSGPCNTCHNLFYGQANPAVRLTIGQDLSNDHPVSIVYNPDRASLRPTDTLINNIDLTTGLAASAVTYMNGNLTQNRWAIRGYISETARISDLLRSGKVECSSCHDPHFKNLSWDEAEPTWYTDELSGATWTYCGGVESCSDGNFLRRVGGNTGSGVCRTCHAK